MTHERTKKFFEKSKKRIESRKRKLFLFMVALVLAISSGGTVWSYATPIEKIEEVPFYTYSQRANVDYLVHMKPTTLFSDSVIEPGRAYITSLVEHVSLNLSYHFSGEREAYIGGEYQANALLSAYSGRGDESQLVWEKKYPLSPSANFASDDGQLSFEETIEIPLSEYLAYVERVKSETGFTPSDLRLDVDYDISLSVEVAEGHMVNENLTPGLTVFLGGNTFTVDVDNLNARSGEILHEKAVAVPWVSYTRHFLIVISAIFLLVLGGFTFLTISKPDTIDKKSMELSRISKRYGNRVVKTTSRLSGSSTKTLYVSSFEELVKVADELSRPIICYEPKGSENSQAYIFQVKTPEQVFSYKLEGS